MSESEPIGFRPRGAGGRTGSYSGSGNSDGHAAPVTAFNRQELTAILALYGRKVAEGEWRDYALDHTRDKAVFSVFRRSCEFPIYRIEKAPRLAKKQGAFSIVTATGLILKRGSELARVLAALDSNVRLVDSRR